LIGRSVELGRIATERAASAPGIVLLAQAGVGKSRLAREALAQAGRDGSATVWVQATRSAATVPLGAFAGVVGADVGSENLFELLRGGVRAMSSLAGGRPLVVGVDDAQLLDPTSAALVLQLTSTATAFVVATVRTGEPCPDAIQSLWKDAGAQRLELLELSRQETEQLVEAVVGGPVEESARQWIWESSQGNALYASELVHGALSKRALRLVDGLWRMPVRPRISSSLAELISAGMAEIGPDERGVLELLALGEPLRVNELVTLTPEGGLIEAEARGLISVEGMSDGGEVRLAHPLYGEAIRASLPSLQAHAIRVQLARLLQAREHPSRDDSLRVARWLLDAGEPIPEALLLDAADAANCSGDPQLAGDLARQALDAGVGGAAAFLLARSHEIRNQFEQAEEVLVATEDQLETQSQALEYLQLQIRVLYWGLQRSEDLHELFTRAQNWWQDEEWRIRLAPLRLYFESRDRQQGRSEVIEESAELLGAEELDPEGRRTVQFARMNALFYSGRGREAHQLALEIRPSLPARDALDEAILRVSCGLSVETGAGLAELDAWATGALPAAVRLGDNATAGVAAIALAFKRLFDGRFVDAGRWLAEAQVHQELHDPDGKLAVTFSLQAWVAYARGDAPAAESALTRGRAALRGEQPAPFEAAYLACAEAWAMAAAGAARRAQQTLLDRAREFADLPLCETRVLYEAMRAGAPAREVAPRLRAISERCDSPLVGLRADHAHHQAARDPKALMQTVDELEEIGARLYACEAAAQAAGLFVGEGRQDSARRAAARSRELFADGQGGVRPSIDGLDGAAVELTARESEMVALARQELTNQQIADRLVLSVRTVETFLYRAMRKLGVNDRRQL
jgi:DNA-binding CsgD family transcriptional regulator